MLSCIWLTLCKAVIAQVFPTVEWVVICLNWYANVALAVQHSYQYIALLVAIEDELYIDRH